MTSAIGTNDGANPILILTRRNNGATNRRHGDHRGTTISGDLLPLATNDLLDTIPVTLDRSTETRTGDTPNTPQLRPLTENRLHGLTIIS